MPLRNPLSPKMSKAARYKKPIFMWRLIVAQFLSSDSLLPYILKYSKYGRERVSDLGAIFRRSEESQLCLVESSSRVLCEQVFTKSAAGALPQARTLISAVWLQGGSCPCPSAGSQVVCPGRVHPEALVSCRHPCFPLPRLLFPPAPLSRL